MMHKIRTGISLALVFSFLFFVTPGVQPETFLHQVVPGDTLYSIARQYSVGVGVLQSVNNISDPSRIRVGQQLIIPRSYTVKPGDTLYGIARSHNLSLNELLTLNQRSENQILRVGEVLVIAGTPPGSSPSQSASPASGTPSSTPSTRQDPQTPTGSTSSQSTTNQSTTVTLDTQTTVVLSPPRTSGTILSSQLSTDGSGTTWPLEGDRYEFAGKFPGIAIVAEPGSPVRSVTSGRVIYSGPHSTLGQVVFVQHPRGFVYIYGGNEALLVKTGDEVTPGTQIGTLGLTPAVGRAQVFFSVWKDGGYLDPRVAPR